MAKKIKEKKPYRSPIIAFLIVLIAGILIVNQYSLSLTTTTKSNAQETKKSAPQWEHSFQNNTNFYTIDGETFIDTDGGPLQNKHVNQNYKYINILFISQNYSQGQLNTFHNDVNKAIRYLLNNVEPFKSRREQIRFLYIDNLSDLKCTVTDEHEMCDENLALDTLYKTQLQVDTTVILINQSIQRAYASALPLGMGVVFLANNNSMNESLGHELGHSLAGLRDEYFPIKDSYPISTNISAGVDRNCYNGTPPAPSWKDLVGEIDYTKGCGETDYYRPYKDNMMVNNLPFFDAPSQEMIIRRFDVLAGKSFDNEIPNISISASPGYREINILSQVSDNVGVIRVAFFKDGNLYHTEYQSPFIFHWNISQEPKTTHVFTAKVYDANGNVGVSDPINVDINQSSMSGKPYDYAKDIRNFIESFLRQFSS